MEANNLIRLPDPRQSVQLEVREVVRDVNDKPHIFLRVRLSGWHFPHRAPEPFLLINREVSRFVIIDREGLVADAYFDKPLQAAEQVSFGYGHIINWDFSIAILPSKVLRLDRSLLPKGTVDPFR